ncbi:uncharacterized protein DUF222 [Actinocrispum wychmicini]|uniref:Uncharacterized protein DUF222 n=2 Tax=Actinocrispum wychmicini TaxID=1213861 RepID=A0A4V2S489_9PSEU|nr:uncharacterized protein DUF222 [Actinocrispum wychmicini]
MEEMSASECLDVLTAAERVIAEAEAAKVRVLARFAVLRPPTRRHAELADGAREEVAIEIGISPQAAATQIMRAQRLATRLPATVDALTAGDIDFKRALAMDDLTEVLSVEDAGRVERRVLAYGGRTNPSRFRDSIRYHVIKVDPSSAERRRVAAREERDVTYMAGEDGVGHLSAALTAEQALAAHQQIDKLARKAKTPDRTLGQCRADVLLGLIFGEQRDRVKVQVNVTVPATTLMGLNEQPGVLSGYGPITAEHARELARDATWRRILTDPAGHLLEASPRRFPSPAMAEHVRLRDQHCRMPGCTTTAHRSEIDHTVRHCDQGLSSTDNLAALCKYHNLLRERSGWDIYQPSEGVLVFTSPEGRRYQTTPPALVG